ncbi:hypothetical protein [Sediminicoccus sp. BL-A-41-H5]|uniref:hypothetical protein n=1 Tax=Sediminicoccus sp. BL-A-41-H5 TaxID=3421106 RepID=UPI003D66BE1D
MLSTEAARVLLGLLADYGAGGLAVAVAFLAGAIERAAPAARGAHAFRPLLLPGLILLWPLVLWRWPPPER